VLCTPSQRSTPAVSQRSTPAVFLSLPCPRQRCRCVDTARRRGIGSRSGGARSPSETFSSVPRTVVSPRKRNPTAPRAFPSKTMAYYRLLLLLPLFENETRKKIRRVGIAADARRLFRSSDAPFRFRYSGNASIAKFCCSVCVPPKRLSFDIIVLCFDSQPYARHPILIVESQYSLPREMKFVVAFAMLAKEMFRSLP